MTSRYPPKVQSPLAMVTAGGPYFVAVRFIRSTFECDYRVKSLNGAAVYSGDLYYFQE